MTKYTITLYGGEPSFDPSVPIELLQGISHQGQCDADVAGFVRAYDVTCDDVAGLARWLSEYSDWDVSDHDANIERACWLMAGDCIEHLWDMGAGRCGYDYGYIPPSEPERIDIARLSADVTPGAKRSFQCDGGKWGYIRLSVNEVELWVCGPVLARIAKIAPIVDALYLPPSPDTDDRPAVRLIAGSTTWTLYHKDTK